MTKHTKSALLKIANEKGWDGMLDVVIRDADPCSSYKVAVKTACKNCDPLEPTTECEDALDDLSECMTENY